MAHFTLYTLDFIHYTPHSTPDTPPPALYTAHFTFHSLQLAAYTSLLCTVRSTLYILFYSPHSTLQTLHFHTLHLCTWHFTLDPHNFALFTLHAAWNLGLAWFSCCVRTLAFCPQLPFFRCISSSRTSKGPLRCRRWTFEASPITCQSVGYADIRQPLRATVRTHMFYPRPLQQTVPQYVGLDVHLTCMRFRPARARWCKKLRSCAAPFVFSSEAPCQASFRPLPSDPQVCIITFYHYTILQRYNHPRLKMYTH